MRSLQISRKVDTVDAMLVASEGVIGRSLGCSHSPDLDRVIEGGRSKHVWIFRVDCQLHDIVGVVHKRVNFLPVFIPVKHPDGLIIRARKNVGHGRMHDDVSDVVRMLVDSLNLLCGVVVKDTDQVII